MDVHAAPLTNLSALLYEMHIILERTKRDLTDFSKKKDKAVALIENEKLPGMDVAAVLHGTAPTIRDAIETNASTIGQLRQRVSEMGLATENERGSGASDSLTYWTPSSDSKAWNIALPGDEHVVPAADPPREQGAGRTFPSVLQYHADVAASEEHPRLFVPWQDLGSRDDELHSRRVVLGSLPRGANAMQVLSAIRCHGGLVSVLVADDVFRRARGGSRDDKTKTALVEFVYARAAADFASHVDGHRLRLRFQDGVDDEPAREVQLHHIPTPSWHLNQLNHELLSAGATRALCMPGFPADAIWHLVTELGTKVISKVHLQGGDTGQDLTIEFVSLFEADRAAHFVKRGRVGVDYDAAGNKMRYVADSSQRGDMRDVFAETGGLIERVEPDVLQKTFDREPFNTYKPARQQPRFNRGAAAAAAAAAVKVRPESCPKRSNQDVLAEYFDIEPAELCDFFRDREHFQDTQYKIIGSNITLTRHRYSWSISKEDDVKLLMANTLHSPEWAGDWDAHFEVQGTIHLGRWERYGMLAEHRRQLAAEQHVDAWAVPRCDGLHGCDWACRALKDTPAASLIKEWRRKRREDAQS